MKGLDGTITIEQHYRKVAVSYKDGSEKIGMFHKWSECNFPNVGKVDMALIEFADGKTSYLLHSQFRFLPMDGYELEQTEKELQEVGLMKQSEEPEKEAPCVHFINGVMIPPCNVGDTVYFIRIPTHMKPFISVEVVQRINVDITAFGVECMISNNSFHAYASDIGKRLFFNAEDAYNALERLLKNDT